MKHPHQGRVDEPRKEPPQEPHPTLYPLTPPYSPSSPFVNAPPVPRTSLFLFSPANSLILRTATLSPELVEAISRLLQDLAGRRPLRRSILEQPPVPRARDNHPRCYLHPLRRRRHPRQSRSAATLPPGYDIPAVEPSTRTVSSWSPSLWPVPALSSRRSRSLGLLGIAGSFLLRALSMVRVSPGLSIPPPLCPIPGN